MTKDDLYNYIKSHKEKHGYEPPLVKVMADTGLYPKLCYKLYDELVADGSVVKLKTERSSQYVLK